MLVIILMLKIEVRDMLDYYVRQYLNNDGAPMTIKSRQINDKISLFIVNEKTQSTPVSFFVTKETAKEILIALTRELSKNT